jgi:hypothetical protein
MAVTVSYRHRDFFFPRKTEINVFKTQETSTLENKPDADVITRHGLAILRKSVELAICLDGAILKSNIQRDGIFGIRRPVAMIAKSATVRSSYHLSGAESSLNS